MQEEKIGLIVKWIADRHISVKSNRSEHADEMIYFAREVIENLENKEHWRDLFY